MAAKWVALIWGSSRVFSGFCLEHLQNNKLKQQQRKNSTYGHLDRWAACSQCICVCGCNSGDGSYTKMCSRTWFSHRALWVSLLVLHSTRRRMFSVCDSESASQFISSSPTPPPPVCHHIPTHHPIHALFHHLTCFSCLFFFISMAPWKV